MNKIKPYDHRAMILNPSEWPRWPLLPLKRKNSRTPFGEMAFLFEPDPGEPITIYLGTMFEDYTKLESKRYANVDALLADGWEVD